MGLASVNLWNIVDEPKPTHLPILISKDIKEKGKKRKTKTHIKKAMFIIILNLADNQLAYINGCKRSLEAWKVVCNIYEARSLSNILFICHNVFKCKMQEDDDLLDRINKVKALHINLFVWRCLLETKILSWLCLRFCHPRMNTWWPAWRQCQ